MVDIIVTIGLSFISIILTINLFILKTISKRIDEHKEILNERGKILQNFEHRMTVLETKTRGLQ